MENFPTEISENILCRLPIDAALQAKRVCKIWRNLLREKTDKVGFLFAESYFDKNRNKLYYGDEYDPLSGKMNNNFSYDNRLDEIYNGRYFVRYGYGNMLGSCNGLVCFQNRRAEFEKPFLICNPLTREVVYVPKPNKSIEQDCSPTDISGFGYCHSKNTYKIVRMHYLVPSKYHVLVYTIGGGGGGWRILGSIHIGSLTISLLYSAGTYANGSLYWLCHSYINTQHDYTIMAFDMEVEKFEFIHLSHFEDLRYIHGPKLLGGSNLYLVYTTLRHQPNCTHIWAYKREHANTTNGCDFNENYNNKNLTHWTKEYSIEWEEPFWNDLRFLKPLAVTRSNEFLLSYDFKTLYCYDLKISTMNKLFDGRTTGCTMINVIPHANSLVSMLLKDLEEVQDPQWVNIDKNSARGCLGHAMGWFISEHYQIWNLCSSIYSEVGRYQCNPFMGEVVYALLFTARLVGINELLDWLVIQQMKRQEFVALDQGIQD